jgi:transcriptional antiterminator RfaH
MSWFVAMTKPNHEGIAAVNLQRQGFTWYYPRYAHKKPGAAAVIRPLFPRYIFVKLEQVWHSLCGTRGISYLLMADSGPQLLPDQVIETIQAREDKTGLYQLVAPPRFRKGTKVKTQEGPLAGLLLCYEGQSVHDRVKVLAELLGRSCMVEIEERLLTAA